MRDCTLSMIVRVKDITLMKKFLNKYTYALILIENFNLDPKLFR